MTVPDLGDVQGNILKAYGRTYGHVRHVVLRVVDRVAAQAALAAMVDGDRSTPEITSAERAPGDTGAAWCLNLGMTHHGLRALGVPKDSLASFPPEFRQGMAARAAKLGDVGDSAPEHWIGGLADTDRVDVIATIHGRRRCDIDPISDQLIATGDGRAFELVSTFDGDALEADGDGNGPYRQVHFGYLDGISQPRFPGIHDPGDYDRRSFAPLGAVLLGYPTAVDHVRWRVPSPEPLGFNGSFNAFRVLRQDVRAFEAFLGATARELSADAGGQIVTPALVAAKLCGRWRNGVPLTLAATEDELRTVSAHLATLGAKERRTCLNSFGYRDADADGSRCPIGAHIRRSNPRDAHIVQRGTNLTRQVVRRGMPYGPRYRPTADGADPDRDRPRGLLGNFLCASLSAQFEALQFDWLNLGLQDPRITGTNDPLVGVNGEGAGRFVWPRAGEPPIVLHDLSRFVTTDGGAYTFLPSRSAVRWISARGSTRTRWRGRDGSMAERSVGRTG
jgi:deferrochelatase/peroxidase EfeB